MRILLLSQFYPPETGAAQNRLSYMVRWLAAAGHEVTVLTALPNYPKGAIFEDYRGRVVAEEQKDGVRIIRTWLYTTSSKAFLRRILNYCSFSLISLLAGLFKAGRQDVVFVESPPLPLGFTGYLLSRVKGARLALNISDLWPESAVALGVLHNRRLIQAATGLEEFLYRNSDVITGQTNGIVRDIQSRFPGKSVTLIPNGVDTALLPTGPRGGEAQQQMRASLGLDARFIVGYAGLFGLAQGLDTIIRAAKALSDFPDILFALFGDGPEKEKLQSLAAEYGLRNIRFYPLQPAARMPQVLGSFDAALVPLIRHPLFKGALPSKMFEAMGAGVPVICSVDGEARDIVEKSGGGIYVEPEQPEEIAEAVLRLYHDAARKQSMGENGRRYVVDHYSRSDAAKRFEQLLLNTSPERRQAPVSVGA